MKSDNFAASDKNVVIDTRYDDESNGNTLHSPHHCSPNFLFFLFLFFLFVSSSFSFLDNTKDNDFADDATPFTPTKSGTSKSKNSPGYNNSSISPTHKHKGNAIVGPSGGSSANKNNSNNNNYNSSSNSNNTATNKNNNSTNNSNLQKKRSVDEIEATGHIQKYVLSPLSLFLLLFSAVITSQ